MFARLEKALWAVGTASALLLASVAPAQAAVYTGKWDPAYGPSLPGLGFQGSADFFVPDACLSGPALTSATQILDFASCSSGAMSLLTAEIEFYDLAAPATILETLVFSPPALIPDPTFSAYVKYNSITGKNEVVGMTTVFIGPETSALALAGLRSFEMVFVWNEALGKSEVYLKDSTGVASNPATANFTATVPEPGSLALVFAALGAGWAVRRRRA